VPFLHQVVEIFSRQRLRPPLATVVPVLVMNAEVFALQRIVILAVFLFIHSLCVIPSVYLIFMSYLSAFAQPAAFQPEKGIKNDGE
jgi:hypothetical protein